MFFPDRRRCKSVDFPDLQTTNGLLHSSNLHTYDFPCALIMACVLNGCHRCSQSFSTRSNYDSFHRFPTRQQQQFPSSSVLCQSFRFVYHRIVRIHLHGFAADHAHLSFGYETAVFRIPYQMQRFCKSYIVHFCKIDAKSTSQMILDASGGCSC